MFPLFLIQYGKFLAGAMFLLGSFYFGWHLRDVDFQSYKAKQAIETQKIQEKHQAFADKIESEKNAQIRNINSWLADALIELRKRPSRTQASSNGQGGTGLSLSAEDSSFLVRESSRADILRTALSACYEQYDALSK